MHEMKGNTNTRGAVQFNAIQRLQDAFSLGYKAMPKQFIPEQKTDAIPRVEAGTIPRVEIDTAPRGLSMKLH